MSNVIKAFAVVMASLGMGLILGTFVNAREGLVRSNHITLCQSEESGQMVNSDSKRDRKCPPKSKPVNVGTMQSAIVRFDYDFNDPYGPGIYNSARSRDIKAIKSIETGDYGSAYCIQLDFSARYISAATVYSVYSSDPNEVAIFSDYCSAPFEYFAWGTAAQSIFFTE